MSHLGSRLTQWVICKDPLHVSVKWLVKLKGMQINKRSFHLATVLYKIIAIVCSELCYYGE